MRDFVVVGSGLFDDKGNVPDSGLFYFSISVTVFDQLNP